MGLRAIVEHAPELVLLDLNLPRMDGYRDLPPAARRIPLTATLPVIVITAHTATRRHGHGARCRRRRLPRQARPAGRARWRASAARCACGESITSLERATQIVAALANAVEAKDVGLVHHCRWLAHHAARVGVQVGLRGEELEAVAYGALLHDVGKIGVPEHLLRKEGPLSTDEWLVMRRHPEIGERICRPLQRLDRAFAPIIRHHHECFDGSGYPDGLRGEQIPLGARIVAVADAYEAMVHGRPYQPAQSHRAAPRTSCCACAAVQFDPELVPVFLDELERDTAGRAATCCAAARSPSLEPEFAAGV